MAKITLVDLAGMVKRGFDGVDKRFEQIDKRFDRVEERLTSLEKGQQDIINNSKLKIQKLNI